MLREHSKLFIKERVPERKPIERIKYDGNMTYLLEYRFCFFPLFFKNDKICCGSLFSEVYTACLACSYS